MSEAAELENLRKAKQLTGFRYPLLGALILGSILVTRVPLVRAWSENRKPTVTLRVVEASQTPVEPNISSEPVATDTEPTQLTPDALPPRLASSLFELGQSMALAAQTREDRSRVASESIVALARATWRTAGTLGPVDETITLINPRKNGAPIRFLLNGHVTEIAAGQVQQIKPQGESRVEFHRGGTWGVATHTLSRGTYVFSVTKQQGWSLERSQP